MTNQPSPHSSSFYTIKSFKNPSTSGGIVWITCAVFGGFFPSFSIIAFRVAAISLSVLISLALLIETENKKKFKYWLLAIANSCLIFVNASGVNSIVFSLNSNRSILDSSDSAKIAKNANHASIIPFLNNQKDWWPDNNILNQNDTLNIENKILRRQNQNILNQISFFKDFMLSNVSNMDSNFAKEVLSLLKDFGKYEASKEDIAELKMDYDVKAVILNLRIDSLKFALAIRHIQANSVSQPIFEIGNQKLTLAQWIDTTQKINGNLLNQYNGWKRKYDSVNHDLEIAHLRINELVNFAGQRENEAGSADFNSKSFLAVKNDLFDLFKMKDCDTIKYRLVQMRDRLSQVQPRHSIPLNPIH